MEWLKNINIKEILKIENWSLELLVSLTIITTIVLFIPENINAPINRVVKQYTDYIVLLNIISWFMLIIFIVNRIINKYKSEKLKKKIVDEIFSLSGKEYNIIKEIINNDDLIIIADYHSGTVYNLTQKGYITMTGSQYAIAEGNLGELFVRFTINPKVYRIIKDNKKLTEKFM